MKSLIGTITTYLLKLVCPILFWASGRLRLGEVQLAGVRPPFLLVANHQTEMDPFYIGVHVPGRISFVATDSLFRNPFMDYIMSALGSIPKSKFDVDPSCIRRMLESVKRGWSVALFPEGQRSMAGYTDAIVPGIGRLAKWLDVPLVVAKLQGGFLARPCWAYWARRGRCALNMKLLFSREQIRQLRPEQIQKAVVDAIRNSDFEWIRTQPRLRFKGTNRAHGLHNIMFACPECGAFDCFLTKGDLSTCKVCGYSVKWGDRGEFVLVRGSRLHHENLELQDKWQRRLIESTVDRAMRAAKDTPICGPCRVTVKRKRRSGPLETLGEGEAVLCADAIRIEPIGDRTVPTEFAIERVKGFSVEAIRGRRNRVVEFLYEGAVYNLVFHDDLESTYKWHLMVRRLKEAARLESRERARWAERQRQRDAVAAGDLVMGDAPAVPV
ncbi:MAG: lysophospholipid acyltransferase family protein [Bacillota bacterium]|jgi:1-acyl-sn-glycerol-3-phosphate acyltransferase